MHSEEFKVEKATLEKVASFTNGVVFYAYYDEEMNITSLRLFNSMKYLGVSEEYFLKGSDAWFARIHPDYLNEVSLEYEKQLLNESCLAFYLADYLFLTKKGYEFFNTRGYFIRDGDGNVVKSFGIMEYSEANVSKLNREKSRFESFFEHSPTPMFIVSLEGRFTESNEAGVRFFGYSKEELKNITFQEITHPDHLETDLDLLSKLVDKEIDSYQMKKQYRNSEGEWIWGLLSGTMVSNEKGEPAYFIAQIVDINDQAKFEEELKLKNESMKEFVYMASHDLKEPLRQANIYTEIIEDYLNKNGKMDDFLKKNHQVVENALNNSFGLINDLLSYHRVSEETGDHSKINIVKLILGVIYSIERENPHVKIIFESSNEITIEGCFHKLEQVFYNLIYNSINHNFNKEDLVIKVSLEDSEDFLRCEVSDNGKGVPKEDRTKVFEPFVSLNSERQNSGLGLAICKKAVDLHNGTIEIINNKDWSYSIRFSLEHKKMDPK